LSKSTAKTVHKQIAWCLKIYEMLEHFLIQAFKLLISSNQNHTSVFDDLPGAKELRRIRKRDVYAAAIDILKLMLSAKLLIELLLATNASTVILRLSSRQERK